MKNLMIIILTLTTMFSAPSFADTKNKKVNSITPAPTVEVKKEKYFKVVWFVKKTGNVIVTHSTAITLLDPENQSKTGKIVFSPQKVPGVNGTYLLGLGIDMKLFDNKGTPVLGMVGQYIDPNPLFDFTEKMPDEQNVAHIALQPITKQVFNGQTISLNTAKFVKAYDLSKPNGQEITLTRFIINEPNEASLIEITFKVYEFNVSEKDKPKE